MKFLMQDKIFYASCFGFLGGVFLRSFFNIDFYFAILIVFLVVSLFLFFWRISKNNLGMVVCIFAFMVSLGIFRFYFASNGDLEFFESKVGSRIEFAGEIMEDPEIRERSQKLIVSTRHDTYKTKILLNANLDESFEYGDEVKVSGKLEKPENFVTDQGKEFDYINYLRKDGIHYIVDYPRVEIISHDNGNRIKEILFLVKNKFLEKINFSIPSPENLLMGGLILGEKSTFSEELRTNFINTGTIHIVALSGYNVTIVSEWLMKLFSYISYLPKNFGIGAGIFSIFLFVLMTGASSTSIRAGVMAMLALVARATGRNYDVARALILAAVFMVLINPFVLVYDVSFQLSFLATIAVIFFAPRFEKYFLWITPHFKLRDIISVTVAVYIFVLPFILYKMGSLSIVALPTNILILPFIPITMLLGFIAGLSGFLGHFLSVPLGYIAYLFLHYELSVIEFFAHIPFASISFPNFPLFLTLIIYGYYCVSLKFLSLTSQFRFAKKSST